MNSVMMMVMGFGSWSSVFRIFSAILPASGSELDKSHAHDGGSVLAAPGRSRVLLVFVVRMLLQVLHQSLK